MSEIYMTYNYMIDTMKDLGTKMNTAQKDKIMQLVLVIFF